jgi:hypothetical protein
MDDLVPTGRCEPAAREAIRRTIDRLNEELATLDQTEAWRLQREEAIRTEAPGLEDKLQAAIQKLIEPLLQARAAAADVARLQQEIVNLCADPDYPGVAISKRGSVRNRDAVVLCGPEGSLIKELTDPYGLLSNFLREAAAAGFDVR